MIPEIGKSFKFRNPDTKTVLTLKKSKLKRHTYLSSQYTFLLEDQNGELWLRDNCSPKQFWREFQQIKENNNA